MGRSGWGLSLVLSLATLCILGVPQAASTPGTNARFLGAHSAPAGPVSPGARLWVRRYNGPANSGDAATAIGVSPDRSKVFVTGASDGSTSSGDYATVAYDASTGDRLWVSRYNGPGDSGDGASALGVSPDGAKVFVTGASSGSTSSFDYATVAYDASTGAELWVMRYNGPGNSDDDPSGLEVSPDGSIVYVTGISTGSTTSADYATVAYDASTGAELWVHRYNGAANSFDQAYALGVSPYGSAVFVTGLSYGSTGSSDYATVAYNASTGAELWVKLYNGPANSFDGASALGVSPDGSAVFVTGSTSVSTGSSNYATVAYDASTGQRLWVNHNGPGIKQDHAYALGVSPDGSMVFVTGVSGGRTSKDDYATVAYDASSGDRLWVSRYNGRANLDDGARAIGVSPDGSMVFVTGGSGGSTSAFDYATVAHNASTGALLWVRRYNGPGNYVDAPSALALSPDGSKVFVTGFSLGSTFVSDYATVAYSVT